MSEQAEITTFVCANCVRQGMTVTSVDRARPAVPDFNLPGRVQQVIVPCTGRLQPEHILRAFEAGSSIVSIIACQEDNCHHAEGSRRCSLRVEHVRSILREIGLSEERLLLFSLPGSASQDLGASAGKAVPPISADSLNAQVAIIRSQTIRAFQAYPSSPLQNAFAGISRGNLSETDMAVSEGDSNE